MLQLYKNQIITSVTQRHVELRQLELDWYTNNFWTLSQQSALLAGFSFGQLTTPLATGTPFSLEYPYITLTAAALGLNLCVLVSTTFCCVWGPGLALRGPNGTQSVHRAVDNLRSEQTFVFSLFVLGLICFLSSNVLLVWVYFVAWVAFLATIILGFFGLAILLFIAFSTIRMRLRDEETVNGKVNALYRYEKVLDLDEMIIDGETVSSNCLYLTSSDEANSMDFPHTIV